jgi:hypothetical protein
MLPPNRIVFSDRPSDSRFVERIFHSHSTRAGTFQSVASSHCEIIFTRCRGDVRVTLRGPETKPTSADCPAEGEWVGIRLALGTYFPHYPAATLRDRRDADLPIASPRAFWLLGSAWEFPTFENAETFVARLVKTGALARDPAVSAALGGEWKELSRRSAQRHFLQATGVTQRTHLQIERARFAAHRLRQGASILEVVGEGGYFDQAHLTRSLRRFIGETPAQLQRQERQLSFLYKTEASRGA